MDRAAFDRVVDALARTDGLRLRSLVVSGPDGAFRHDATPDGPVDVRSLTKPVVALAVGAAAAAGVRLRGRPLSPDLPVAPFFGGRLPGVRIRHLLTNTTGFADGFRLFRADLAGRDPDTLLEHVLDHEIVHPPGTHFAYSNAGWYLLSALVAEELGVRLRDWVTEHLLGRLGITDAGWTALGRYDPGGTGLRLTATGVHAVGTLLRDGGRGIVPRAWVEAVLSPAVPARCPDDLGAGWRPTSYGYGMWVRPDGVPFCYGRGGRLLAVDPRTGTVVTAITETDDTAAAARCLRGAL